MPIGRRADIHCRSSGGCSFWLLDSSAICGMQDTCLARGTLRRFSCLYLLMLSPGPCEQAVKQRVMGAIAARRFVLIPWATNLTRGSVSSRSAAITFLGASGFIVTSKAISML